MVSITFNARFVLVLSFPFNYTPASTTPELSIDLSHSVCLCPSQGLEVLGVSDSTSEVSVSCSSTDDTTSLHQPSSSAESSEEVRRRGAGAGGGDAEEEAKDRVTEVPLRSSLLRSTACSQSPFRRHSWGPGKNQAGEGDMNQRRYIRGWRSRSRTAGCIIVQMSVSNYITPKKVPLF